MVSSLKLLRALNERGGMISERDMIEEGYGFGQNQKTLKTVFDKMDREQYLNQELKDVLRERDFERVDMYTWIFNFPKRISEEERWIKVILEEGKEAQVNMNDEYVFVQSATELLNCLLFNFYGYGNAR